MTKSVVVFLLGCINNQLARKKIKNPCSDIHFSPIVVSTLLKNHGATKTAVLNGVALIGNRTVTKLVLQKSKYTEVVI